MVYGFDTNRESDYMHNTFRTKPLFRNIDWFGRQLDIMTTGLLCVNTFEEAYYNAGFHEKRQVGQAFMQHLQQEFDFPVTELTSAMCNEWMHQQVVAKKEEFHKEYFCQCHHSVEYAKDAYKHLGSICESCGKQIDLHDYPDVVAELNQEKNK